ncbi:MAG: helix-turn-helix transcriptional regulator [Clostridia bacterium]|jgi:transcriptional regulator with XRE-family HTH domain|nr:helix-turn-helix transcriptional regulator [Clostridia bacterium]MCI9459015.1 helix-turn-helix transcriptional regulator [Clostridia bacterium]
MVTIELIRSRLIEAIKLSELSQTELAKKLNVKQPTVSMYLSGKAMPALDTFANICAVLDVDPAYILGITDNIGNRK